MAPKDEQKGTKSAKGAEKKPAAKTTKGLAEKKPKDVRKKRTKKGVETYKIYIYKVLKQVICEDFHRIFGCVVLMGD